MYGLSARLWTAIGLVLAIAGCAARSDAPIESRTEARSARAADPVPSHVVFYLDGAGGGGPITDGTPDVRRGFRESGFAGEFRPFRWQTGLGALADQVSSLSYKRRAGQRLAAEIQRVLDTAPATRIKLVATSAGTAVALFALEALPEGRRIDSAVLLSSAVSADYDLTAALARIDRQMVVFRNEHDSLLRSLIPVVGSADRRRVGDRVAGLYGFIPTDESSPECVAAYKKLVTIDWCDEFRRFNHPGGHTDCKSPTFICRVIAPLVFEEPAQSLASR